MGSDGSSAAAQHAEFTASEGYKQYVVWLLFIVYVFNFVDRQILTTVIEPIKKEFGLHDWQLGLLSGLAFAVLYTTLGIPIARMADSKSRVNIVTLSLVTWSAFTAITGLAQNFWHLFFARLGVGVGEAGCSPPAYSLISDYFEPKKRATALSIYSMGVYGGSGLGFLVGALIAHEHGWRAAFYAVGLPGVALALIVKATLREPPRGFSEGTHKIIVQPPPFMEVLTFLWSKRSFRHLSFAAGLHAFVSYGVSSFYASFLIRTHGMPLNEVGPLLAVVAVVGGFLGTYFGGWISDRYYARKPDPRYYLWIPAISLVLCVPVGLLAYSVESRWALLATLIPYVALAAAYLAPSIATTHRLVGLRERALAAALLLFVLNLIGLGLGPVFTGALSDAIASTFIDDGVGEKTASALGMQWAIRITVIVNFWSAVHYWWATKTLNQDIVSGELRASQPPPARA